MICDCSIMKPNNPLHKNVTSNIHTCSYSFYRKRFPGTNLRQISAKMTCLKIEIKSYDLSNMKRDHDRRPNA
jgi:hypothetical protein